MKTLGLSAYELSFGRGFYMKLATAKIMGKKAASNNVKVSVHAPFYINFANQDEKKIQNSIGYITKGLRYVEAVQGEHLVFHLASQGTLTREEALNLVNKNFDLCLEEVYKLGLGNIKLCPETMGKFSQIGNDKEIIDFCTRDKLLVPTFDFGHLNCLCQGGLKTKDDYKRIFDYSFEKLGEEKTKNCHIHFSKIEYTGKGEVRHLNYDSEEFGPDFTPLAEVLHDYNLTPTIICESKTMMAEDALTLKSIYENKAKN